MRMQETGMVDKWYRNTLMVSSSLNTNNHNKSKNLNKKIYNFNQFNKNKQKSTYSKKLLKNLGINDLYSIFVVLSFGVITSVIMFALELYIYRHHHYHQQFNNQ